MDPNKEFERRLMELADEMLDDYNEAMKQLHSAVSEGVDSAIQDLGDQVNKRRAAASLQLFQTKIARGVKRIEVELTEGDE